MMKLSEAKQLVQEWRKSEANSAGDCGDRWAFSFEADNDCLGGLIALVDKNSGEVEALSTAEFMYALIDGKISYNRIDVEEEAQ